jgi:peptidoglycan/LPS O-acetylase OafA/YrhL
VSATATPPWRFAAGGQGEAPSPALAPPPGNPRFPLFDGLRGIAVLGILAFHVFETTGRLGFGILGKAAEVLGTQAVIVFFAISGFLLYRPYVAARARDRPGPRTARYARRRAFRILPAYWTVLTLLGIFPGIVGVISGSWWRYYGYLQLYSGKTLSGGIPVAWTLCVEVTYYLLLPLWAHAVRRIRWRGLLGAELLPLAVVAAGGIAVQIAAARGHIGHLVGVSLVGQITWIAIGMGLAVLSVAAESGPRLRSAVELLTSHSLACWALALGAFAGLVALVPAGGLFGLIAAVQNPQPVAQSVAKVALEGVMAATLLLPAIFVDSRRDAPRRLLTFAPVVWLGVISYSFYLWHFTVIQVIALDRAPGSFSAGGLGLLDHLHTARTGLLYLISLIATGLLASASYRLVELPFLRRKG